VFGRRDPAIGPAQRPLRHPVATLTVGCVALLLTVGGIAAWLIGGDKPSRGLPTTRVELPLPPEPPAMKAPPTGAGISDPGRTAQGGDAALIEHGAAGPLPMVADDGRKAWQVYARPFDRADQRPRIAIVLGGLGQASAETQAALDKLPGGVTLVFNPYTRNLPDWVEKARNAQHEVILAVPMEPVDYPREDPGPATLLTALSPRQNLDRLEWTLSRVVGYVGVTNMMGSRFVGAANELRPIIEVIKGRGLLFLETRAVNQSAIGTLAREFGLPQVVNDRDLDADLTPASIEQALTDLEQMARHKKTAVAIGSAYPLTIDRVVAWIGSLDGKGLALAPVSAVVTPQSETKAAPP
jgi:polysaccharide deacetylase 2 family uncharacterized protein YibQ